MFRGFYRAHLQPRHLPPTQSCLASFLVQNCVFHSDWKWSRSNLEHTYRGRSEPNTQIWVKPCGASLSIELRITRKTNLPDTTFASDKNRRTHYPSVKVRLYDTELQVSSETETEHLAGSESDVSGDTSDD